MSHQPTTDQSLSTNSIFNLMPDEYIRYEYSYKPGCCCFSSKITTITNMRLITRVIKTPNICSRRTATGKEKSKMIFLTDVKNIKQLKSAIPSSQNTWWIKCMNLLTCERANQQINWLQLCHGSDNLAGDLNDSSTTHYDIPNPVLIEKF